jgi:hypothetical protein
MEKREELEPLRHRPETPPNSMRSVVDSFLRIVLAVGVPRLGLQGLNAGLRSRER